MTILTHTEIISKIPSQFEKAKSSNALLFFPSTVHRVKESGLTFEITTCPALQKKPTLPTPDFVKHDKPDPFAPPYVEDLYVGEVKDELDGDEYVVLMNKYSVIPGHFLLVTKDFKPQDSPLTPPDLTQTYLLIRAARKASKPIFAFYNCGKDSGASQPHKHIQFIPTNEGDDEEEEEGEGRRPPAEGFISRLRIENDTKIFTLPLPYVHLVHKLSLPKSTISGSKPLSEEALEELSRHLTDVFLKLLDEALQSFRLHASTEPPETGQVGSPSFNIILTSEHMHLIPRRREVTFDELHPVHEEDR
ncbi:bifunctional AP-4-A phosphorylase/ADP sulfurylase, partial [Ceratobasidium sp. 392]